MDLKKFAIRGIVILAAFVALCMFFSGTIRTITTPKVQLTSAKRGKLEEREDLSCKLVFSEKQPIEIELPEDVTLTVTRVNARDGYAVNAGDVVVEAKVTGFEQLRKRYQDAYDEASEALIALENKNRGIRITRRDQEYADAYFGLRDARRAAVNAELEMDTLMSREGLKRAETGYPEGASDDLKAAVDAWRAAVQARADAQTAMDEAARYTVEESVWSYISEKRENQQKAAEAEASLRELMALNDRVQAFAAPHDGYIAELSLKEGDVCDGSQPVFCITAEGKLPVLRADVSEVERAVTVGMAAVMNADSYDPIETAVVDIGADAEGKAYADIEVTDDIIHARGSVYAMLQEETPLTLIYRAREASALLPTNAVRGSGDDRYVYVVEQNNAAFGGNTLKIHKMSVNVIGEYGGTTALKEDLSYYSIAYGEDRAIDDGTVVMEYLK